MAKLLCATAAAGALATIAACGSQTPQSSPAPPAISPAVPTAKASAPPAGGPVTNNGPTYKTPADTCKIIAAEPFADLYPGTQPKFDALSPGSCNVRFGGPASQLIIGVTVEVSGSAAFATAQFEALRNLGERHYPNGFRHLSGAGSAAYTYQGIGTTVVVVHGNANLRITVAKAGSATMPPDAAARATRVANQVLQGLLA